jgi:hypothetical protein
VRYKLCGAHPNGVRMAQTDDPLVPPAYAKATNDQQVAFRAGREDAKAAKLMKGMLD